MKSRFLLLAALLLLAASPARAAENHSSYSRAAPAGAMDDWDREFRAEAMEAGVSPETLDRILPRLAILPEVVRLDRNQPEGKTTWAKYRASVLGGDRVARGRQMMNRHAALLQKVSRAYGVKPETIVALWGLESSYGRLPGKTPTLSALYTLARDGRRPQLFRSELIQALLMVDRGDATEAQLRGSWAGAMGQTQFMPSSYNKYAVDFDGNGHPDIWGSTPDAFASIANYLARNGWNDGQLWGRQVKLPDGYRAPADPNVRRTVTEWTRRGIRRLDGSKMPANSMMARIVTPDGPKGQAFLVYDNFKVYNSWNRSTYFGLTAGLLSDALVAK